MFNVSDTRVVAAATLAVVMILGLASAGRVMADNQGRAASAGLMSDRPSAKIVTDDAQACCNGRGTQLQALVEPGSAVEPLTYEWNGPGLAAAGPVAVVADSLAPGTYTYSLVVRGRNGLVSEEVTQTLTVLAGVTCVINGPDVVCPASVTTYCGPEGGSSYQWSISGAGTIVGASTNLCVDVRASSGCAREFTLTLRVGSGTGCPSICSRNITVFDVTPPVITCPADVTIECGGSTDPANTGTPTVTDACDASPTVTYSDVSTPGTCPILQTITRTWRAADDCGNSATCVQTIGLVDAPPDLVCPGPVTIGCDEPADPSRTGTATATDACGGTVTVTFSDVTSPGSCPQAWTIDRTWSATDGCGNISTCHQAIAVVDTVGPRFSVQVPSEITVECGSVPDPATVTATDNCDTDVTIDFSQTTIGTTCPDTYDLLRVWSATDDCGNRAEMIQIVHVVDNTPPVVTCPPEEHLQCRGDVPAPDINDVVATDNCDDNVTVLFVGDTTDGRTCPETVTRTYQATDDCGNTAYCTQAFVIQDTTRPTIVCPNDTTIVCGDPTDPAYTGYATASDSCTLAPSVTHTDNVTYNANPCGVLITRTWAATDDCLNTATCVQRIVCVDTTDPQFTSTPATHLTVDCGAVPAAPTLAATDACDPDVAVTFDEQSEPGECGGEYTLIRTWTAEDNCGHYARFVQTISVVDTIAPYFTTQCPANTTVNCNQVPEHAEMTAEDDCIGTVRVVFREERDNGSCPGNYTLTRTWTAPDNCGNYVQCVQVVTVKDDTPPVITCPGGMTLQCDDPSDPGHTGFATAGDGCDGMVTNIQYHDRTVPGAIPGSYQILRTWLAIDNCGNADSCVQTLTVIDDGPPRITCPADVRLQCDQPTDPANTGYATAEDDCDELVIPGYFDSRADGRCPQTYTITRTWIASDASGNSDSCYQTITVADTIPPVITCPSNVTVQCSESTDPAATGRATAVDNCDPDPAIDFQDGIEKGSCPSSYVIERLWVAVDTCGNLASCVQMIAVVDTTAPVIVCPADTTVSCTGSTSPEVTGHATASDNCSAELPIGYNDVRSDGSCPQAYSIARTWSTVDGCGNPASCVQTITVVDIYPPNIYCPSDVTIQCSESTDPSHTGYATAWDSCDTDVGPIYSDQVVPGVTSQSYQIVRTWTATDDCLNSASCIQIITVIDTAPPRIVCPGDVTVECGQPTDPDHTGHAEAYDDCDNELLITWSDQTTPGSCPQAYTITRTWRAEDNSGNSVTCAQVIRVVDDEAPVITCPGNRTFECNAVINFGLATAVDNCDPTPTIGFSDVVIPGSNPQSYVVQRTWTATDDCGNVARCVQRVTVVDRTGPVLIAAPDERVLCNQPVVFTDPQIKDSCDTQPTLTVVSNTVEPGPGTCEYTYTRCWRGQDASGNLSATVCQSIIRYEDTEGPVLTCAADKEIEIGEPVVFDEPEVSDNCLESAEEFGSLSSTLTSAFADGETTYTRCWLAYDLCGNQSNECCQSITVRGQDEPEPYCSFVCWNWTAACLKDPYNHEISTPPACLRDEHFDDVFPNGVTIGTHASAGLYTATWTSAGAVEDFKCGYGLPEALHANWVDPSNTQLGALQAEILTLRLNREFSCAGYFEAYGYPQGEGCFGELIVPLEGLRFAGLTVDQFLAIADRAVAGDKSALLPYGYSYYRLYSTAAYLNWLYGECNGYGSRNASGPIVVGGTDGDSGWEDEVDQTAEAVPEQFSMKGSPNPTRGSVTISLALPADGDLSLDIYDVQGRVVTTLMSGHKSAGYYSVTWDGVDGSGARVVSGIYFCRVQIDGQLTAMEKLMKL